ncbi:hypothetical protein Golob_019805, partial [Gossypium lobatum]|nr:hypothetical protein [Gossypium lobatum]
PTANWDFTHSYLDEHHPNSENLAYLQLLPLPTQVGMGSDEEERLERKSEELKKIVDTCIACLWSFLVSLSGALMLGWWGYEYHPTNSQLWLVPFGLILFVTPLIIWFAIFVSYFCNFTGDDSSSSLHDPERMIDHVIPTR